EKCRDLIKDASLDTPIYGDDSVCNFSKFARVMQLALDYGLNSELAIALSDQGGSTAPKKPSSKPSTAPPAATTKTGTGTNASPDVPQPASPSANATANNSAIGRLCWDPNLARPDNRHDIITYMHNDPSHPPHDPAPGFRVCLKSASPVAF